MGRHGLIVAVVLVVAGCGPTPPQAPGPEAHQLNLALSRISTACGHAAEAQTFTNDKRTLTTLEDQAGRQIPTLVRIYRRNPAWIFQGKSVAELVHTSRSFLDECGLHTAARRLAAATSSK